jgi:Zn-dependent membrane protease YugP
MFWIALIALMIMAGWAQMATKGRFERFSKVPASCGLTGAQAADSMLRSAGVTNVDIEVSRGGMLSDHYDPIKNVIRLSPEVYSSRSVAALAVACHEAGHALQKANAYAPLVIRNTVVPLASFGSGAGMFLIMIGLFINALGLAAFGLVLYATVVFFQLINLPVEFDASARAKKALTRLGMIQPGAESEGVSKVLSAAAMTYVAATLTSVFYLIYYAWLIFGNQNRN